MTRPSASMHSCQLQPLLHAASLLTPGQELSVLAFVLSLVCVLTVCYLQVSKAQQEDVQKALQRRQQQQQLAAMRAAQVAEVQAQREAQRQAKLREIEETNAAVQAAYEAECREHQQHRAAQQRQMALYKQQQQEAEAVKRAAAAVAAREHAYERAEIAAVEAEAAAAAAARAAAERAKLEAFKSASAAAVEAKKLAAVETREKERQFVEECKRVSCHTLHAGRKARTCAVLPAYARLAKLDARFATGPAPAQDCCAALSTVPASC